MTTQTYRAHVSALLVLESDAVTDVPTQPRMKRYQAALLTDESLGGAKGADLGILKSAIDDSPILAVVRHYMDQRVSPTEQQQVFVNAKFVALPGGAIELDVMDGKLILPNMSPDDPDFCEHAPEETTAFAYIFGEVSTVHQRLSYYPAGYRAFDIKTGSYDRSSASNLTFTVRFLLDSSRRWVNTPPPEKLSLVFCVGTFLGVDNQTKLPVWLLQDIMFLMRGEARKFADREDSASGTASPATPSRRYRSAKPISTPTRSQFAPAACGLVGSLAPSPTKPSTRKRPPVGGNPNQDTVTDDGQPSVKRAAVLAGSSESVPRSLDAEPDAPGYSSAGLPAPALPLAAGDEVFEFTNVSDDVTPPTKRRRKPTQKATRS